jgi:hypothetical protein
LIGGLFHWQQLHATLLDPSSCFSQYISSELAIE